MKLKELEKYIEAQVEKVRKDNEKSAIILNEFQMLKDYVYNQSEFNDVTDIIMHINNSSVFSGFKEHIINLLNDIKILKDLLNEVENNLSNIDISTFQWNLNNKADLFDDIGVLKDLYVFAINPDFEDQELKNGVFKLKDKIISKINSEIDKNIASLKKSIETIEMRNISKARRNIKDNDEHLLNLKLYLEICNKNKRVETEEEMRQFLEFIKNSTLPKDLIYKLIIDFSKNNITYYNSILRKKLSRDKLVVNKNKEIVHEKLRQLASEKLPKVEVEKNSESLLSNLTQEEKDIYNKVRKLLEDYLYDDSFFEIFEDNFSLNDRLSYYGSVESIDWNSIKSDFIYILEPNLSGNQKSEIFSIFNYILELNEKNIKYKEKIRLEEEINQAEKEMALKKLSILCEEIDKILRRHKSDLDYLEQDEHRATLCSKVYDLSKTDIEQAKLIIERTNKSIEDFKILHILKELNDYMILINKDDLSTAELEQNCKNLKNLLEEYEVIFDKISKSIILSPKAQINKYNGENFICFMNENISFETKGIKEEVKETIKILKNTEWYEIVSSIRHLWSDLTHKTPSGKEKKYSNDRYSVGRIWATGDYRTGLVVIRNICPENKEKIKKRYNLEKVGVIAFVIGAIYVKADHSEYKELTNFMNSPENQATINYYVELFANKDTPEEKLFEILDKGISDCNKINSNQADVGGNVYA